MRPAPGFHWALCWLLFAATALSFLDRQVLSVLAPVLSAELGLTNTDYSRVVFAFVLSYTVMFTAGGRLLDRLGVRVGMALAVGVWSLASAAHAAATSALGLALARFWLGFGEGACFPGATKGAAEWFPTEQRVLALGIANGGSAFGAVLAPPLTALLAARYGWRGAFLATGLLGAAWVAVWLAAFRRGVGRLSPLRDAPPMPAPVTALLSEARVRAILLARFLFDPVFYFYMFWIPQYLARERHFSLERIGAFYWMPFLVLGLSNIFAGHVSDLLVRRGWPARRARFALLTAAALLTPASWLAALAPTAFWALALMCVLMLAHGFWISNFLGLLSDTFPCSVIATVTGLSGTAGGIAGIISNLIVGPVIDRYSFTPAFAASGVCYPLALLVLAVGTRRAPRIPPPQ